MTGDDRGAADPAPARDSGKAALLVAFGIGLSRIVGLVRERFFSPRLRVKSYEELNAWLLDQCIAYAKAHRHPEFRDQTVGEAFEA